MLLKQCTCVLRTGSQQDDLQVIPAVMSQLGASSGELFYLRAGFRFTWRAPSFDLLLARAGTPVTKEQKKAEKLSQKCKNAPVPACV